MEAALNATKRPTLERYCLSDDDGLIFEKRRKGNLDEAPDEITVSLVFPWDIYIGNRKFDW